MDNANLRTILDQTNGELQSLRAKMNEFDTMQKKLVKMQQQCLASEKENKGLKNTLKYLQTELVKSGKKLPLDPGSSGNGKSSQASGSASAAPLGASSGAAQSPSLKPPWQKAEKAKPKFSLKKKSKWWKNERLVICI